MKGIECLLYMLSFICLYIWFCPMPYYAGKSFVPRKISFIVPKNKAPRNAL